MRNLINYVENPNYKPLILLNSVRAGVFVGSFLGSTAGAVAGALSLPLIGAVGGVEFANNVIGTGSGFLCGAFGAVSGAALQFKTIKNPFSRAVQHTAEDIAIINMFKIKPPPPNRVYEFTVCVPLCIGLSLGSFAGAAAGILVGKSTIMCSNVFAKAAAKACDLYDKRHQNSHKNHDI